MRMSGNWAKPGVAESAWSLTQNWFWSISLITSHHYPNWSNHCALGGLYSYSRLLHARYFNGLCPPFLNDWMTVREPQVVRNTGAKTADRGYPVSPGTEAAEFPSSEAGSADDAVPEGRVPWRAFDLDIPPPPKKRDFFLLSRFRPVPRSGSLSASGVCGWDTRLFCMRGLFPGQHGSCLEHIKEKNYFDLLFIRTGISGNG